MADIMQPIGSQNELPYLDQLNNDVNSLGRLIQSYEIAQPREQDLMTARNFARQSIFSRGLDGPLAAAVEADAGNRVVDAFSRRRDDTLSALTGQRSNLLLAIQQQEWQRRVAAAQAEQLRRQANADKWGGLFQLLGTGAGAALGGMLGGPVGAIAGAGIGGGAGTGLGGFFR